jgi:hypothetical protein
MTEIEELRLEVANLRKLVEAIAMGRATAIGDNGKMKPYDGPCVYEARTWDGRMLGGDRAWCQAHGFNCPNLAVGR